MARRPNPDAATFPEFELPRTCKKCKEEKAAEEFYTTDKRSYTGWCKTCRKARWEFLKAQKVAVARASPTLEYLLATIQSYSTSLSNAINAEAHGDYDVGNYHRQAAAGHHKELRRLQEDYTWTAQPK